MTVRKSKQGKWQVMIRVKGVRNIYKTFDKKSEARIFKVQKLNEINTGNNLSLLYSITLQDLVKRHLEKSIKYLKPRTQKDRKLQLKKIVKDFQWLMQIKLSDLSAEDFEQFKDERSKDGTINKIATNRDLSLFSKLLNEARRIRLIPIPNHASIVQRFPETQGKHINITYSQYRNLLKGSDEYFKLAILIAKHTGLRKSEILNLKWTDYDLIKKKLYIGNPKNNHPRVVNVSAKLASDIEKLKRKTNNKEYIIGLKFNCFSSRYVRLQRTMGIETCMHDFRRYRTLRLVDMNVHPVQIAKQLGHRSLAMVSLYAGLTL